MKRGATLLLTALLSLSALAQAGFLDDLSSALKGENTTSTPPPEPDAPKRGSGPTSDTRAFGVGAAPAPASEKRIALVIGNNSYKDSPLKNPVNDAKDIAAQLRKQGFEVIERNNLQQKQIGSTLRELRSKLTPGAVALVFYAGHGLQIKGDNYLPAVDAEINSEEDVPNQSLAVRQIMDVLDESKTRLNLVFLDACRNNPYARSFRSADKGLARVSAPSGTLISYATRPGSVAADGNGRNGLYTSKLLTWMDSPLLIEQALKKVASEVKAASQGKQEPWMEGSIEGDFCFAGCATAAPASAATAAPSAAPARQPTRIKTPDEIEQETWDSVRESGNLPAVQEYLKQYPKGRFARQAKTLIATLKSAPAKPVEAPAPAAAPARTEDAETALWTEVQKGNSKEDYDAYLGQYPKGKYTALARTRIRKLQDDAAAETARKEQEAWEAADKSASEDGYQSYLKGWPNGKYAALASVRLRKLEADLAAQRKAIPPRPQLPFTLSEEVWKTIEASEAYRNLPRTRPVKVSSSSSTLYEYNTSVKIPNTTSSGTQTKERTPLGDRCTTVDIRMKNRFSNTDSNVDITTYQCGFFALGSVSNGKTSTILNSIDEIKGSLHPMRIGARMSIRTRTASLTDAKHGYSNASSCEVVSQSPASELDGRLTGKAWKMRCTGSFTSNYNDKTTTSDSDNYYLEDLGVYLSEIGEFELEQKKFYIPRKGEQRRNKVGDTAIQTKTWHSYEWTAGR